MANDSLKCFELIQKRCWNLVWCFYIYLFWLCQGNIAISDPELELTQLFLILRSSSHCMKFTGEISLASGKPLVVHSDWHKYSFECFKLIDNGGANKLILNPTLLHCLILDSPHALNWLKEAFGSRNSWSHPLSSEKDKRGWQTNFLLGSKVNLSLLKK